MFLKAFVVGLMMALGEVINGNVRVRILNGVFGKKRAKIISFFSGITIIFAISWIAFPWINPASYLESIITGSIWLIIMMCLDVYFARYVFNLKWNKILDDFNPVKGNLLGIGMLFLFFCPIVLFLIHK